MPSQPHGARRDRLLSLGREPGARREGRERGEVELFPQRGAGTAVPSAQARAAVPSAQARRRNVGGVRAGTAAGQGGGEPGDAAAAAGGERPADPLHCGVPEQGPRHRLRAVPAYPAQKPHLFSHNCRCDATQRAEDYRVTARTQLRHFIELQKGFSLDCHCEREV